MMTLLGRLEATQNCHLFSTSVCLLRQTKVLREVLELAFYCD